ncbi:MAG: FAD-dependent oxidoreductase [Desulfurococcales archaeon]|jgi:thioredoxin reductase (NADPH)|nr:FAD-dependent oxidoreductase [Desulfurococcales archaeon]
MFRLKMPKPVSKYYDVIVVGLGPAGLAAGLYSARYMLKTLIIGETVGGQLSMAGTVDDYPGFIEIQASDLVARFREHVEKHKADILIDKVENIRKTEDQEYFEVETRRGERYYARAVILAVGLKRRKLGAKGEDEYAGRGVSYCTVCDIPFFKGKRVAIVGGGNSGVTGAVHAIGYVEKLYLITRGDRFRAFPIYVNRLLSYKEKYPDKIEIIFNSTITEIGGREQVEYAIVTNLKTGEKKKIDVEGVFVEIGNEPPTEFFKKIGLETDERGLIIVKPGGYTNIEGIFAAGDCAGGPYKYYFQQVLTSAAEGAAAADAAFKWIIGKGFKIIGLEERI